jgi:hypothetical protein
MQYPIKLTLSDLEDKENSTMSFYLTREEASSNVAAPFMQQLTCKASGLACSCGRCNYNPMNEIRIDFKGDVFSSEQEVRDAIAARNRQTR